MRQLNINGKKYTELEVRQKKQEWLDNFIKLNGTEKAVELTGIDKAFEAYKKEIDDFLELCSVDDIGACANKNERIELAKLRRRDGHGAWSK